MGKDLDYIDVFVRGKSTRTQRTWRSLAKKLKQYLEKKQLTLDNVQPIHIREFIYDQKTMNTMNSYKIFLKAFFKSIGRTDLVDDMRRGLRDVQAQIKFKVDLTLEEVMNLINLSEELEQRFAWSLMAFDGFRAGDVLGLYFEDMNLEKMEVCLRKREGEMYGPKAKKPSQEPNYLRLNPLSASIFEDMPKGHGRILPVSYTTLGKWWKKAVKRSGLRKDYPLTMHKLRHFFGHYWATEKKGSIRVLKEVMRHSKIEYTMIYTEPTKMEIQEEFKKVIG